MSGIKITAPYAVLDKIIKIAHGFTAREPSAPAFQRCILFEADDEALTVIAQSEHNAVKIIKDKDVKILSPGRFMVQAHYIATAFGVMQSDQEVTIEYDSETRHILLRNHDQVIDLPLPVIGDNVNIPSVGDPILEHGVEFDPEDFRDAYNSIASARNTSGTIPILSGVLAEPDLDANLLRMLASDGQACTATESVEIKPIGDGCKPFIFDSNSLSTALGYFGEGQRVDMHSDSKGRLHFLVRGKEDAVIYHIRSGILDAAIEKFPSMKLRNSVTKLLTMSRHKVSVDKAEFQRILQACSALGMLDPTAAGGQARKIGIRINEDGLTPYLLTGAQYDETIPALVDPIDGDIEFVLSYGLYGHLITAYHNEKNPAKINFGVVYDGDRVKSIALYRDDLLLEEKIDGETRQIAPEYICIVGVSAPKK